MSSDVEPDGPLTPLFEIEGLRARPAGVEGAVDILNGIDLVVRPARSTP